MKDVFSFTTQNAFPNFEKSIRDSLPDLPRREAQVAQYMLLNVEDLSFETGASLAKKVGVSEVTVSRLLRRLGYQGMRGLKKEIRNEHLNRQPDRESGSGRLDLTDRFTGNLELEYKAILDIYQQCASPMWAQLIQTITEAERVYVTGFQAVRGVAEDCARRLSISRSNVHFLAAHDSMLTEWLEPRGKETRSDRQCLILVDVVPYAREARVLARMCNQDQRALVIITDEMCHWAKNHTEFIVHANTRTGLILESTVAISSAINLLVNSVAEHSAETLSARLDQWKSNTRALRLF